MSNFSTDKDFEEFLVGERTPLLHYTYDLTKNSDRVEDLIQMAFAKFWKDRDSIFKRAVARRNQDGAERPLESYFRAWLRVVIKNAIKDEMERASAKNVPMDENIDFIDHRSTKDGSSAEALSIASLYADFLEQLSRHNNPNEKFRAWAAACVQLDGNTYEETAMRLRKEAPEWQEGHSTIISAQRSRVEAAVKRADTDFMKWLYEDESLLEK